MLIDVLLGVSGQKTTVSKKKRSRMKAAFSPSSAAVPVTAKIDLPTELSIFIAKTAGD